MSALSVIVPVYKVEQYLNKCVESILNQTFTDFELILVDDGSPDNCPRMCDEWAKKDSRIKVIHKLNGGLSDARNVAIDYVLKESNSGWITFIDSDDWVHSETLERLYNANIENQTNISICNFQKTIGEEEKISDSAFKSQLFAPEDFYVNHNVCAIIACAKLYKKELFTNVRYPKGKLHEDEYTTHLLLFACEKIAYIEAPMYMYFQNPNSITHNLTIKNFENVLEALNEQLVFFQKNSLSDAQTNVIKRIGYYIPFFYSKYTNGNAHNPQSELKKFRKLSKPFLKKFFKIKENCAAYEAVYPKLMKWYWRLQAVKKKIFR